MPTFKAQEQITAPQAWLFDLSQDYSRRQHWDPFIESYTFDSPEWIPSVGAEVSSRGRNGHTVLARYVAFNPPEAVAFKMVSGPWFFLSFAGAWRFVYATEDRTDVSFNYNFTARPGFLRWLLEPLLYRSLQRHIRARISGFKAYAEEVYKSHTPDKLVQ